MPNPTRPAARKLAEVYLHNETNRAIFGRAEGYRDRQLRECGGEIDSVDFLLGERFRADARSELEPLARCWDRYLSKPVRRVLDAGCGPGVTTLALADRYVGATVDGVDVEGPALDLARYLASNQPRCRFHERSLECFEPDEVFDLIQCRAVIEHVFDPQRVLARLLKWLRPGGALYVETPNYLYPWEPHVRLPMLPKGPKRLLELECRMAGRDPAFVHHLNLECNPWTLRRWARATGEDVEIVDLMEEKVKAIFVEGSREPVVDRRARVARLVRRSVIVSRLTVATMKVFPLAPSVILLFVKPPAKPNS
jgi:2-polyprenyl-3-methyl-5-hydroxy-6-metoxy-1,4-benzoquinol methylase